MRLGTMQNLISHFLLKNTVCLRVSESEMYQLFLHSSLTAKSQLNAAVIINHTLDFVKTLVTPKNCVALNKEKSISVNPTI